MLQSLVFLTLIKTSTSLICFTNRNGTSETTTLTAPQDHWCEIVVNQPCGSATITLGTTPFRETTNAFPQQDFCREKPFISCLCSTDYCNQDVISFKEMWAANRADKETVMSICVENLIKDDEQHINIRKRAVGKNPVKPATIAKKGNPKTTLKRKPKVTPKGKPKPTVKPGGASNLKTGTKKGSSKEKNKSSSKMKFIPMAMGLLLAIVITVVVLCVLCAYAKKKRQKQKIARGGREQTVVGASSSVRSTKSNDPSSDSLQRVSVKK